MFKWMAWHAPGLGVDTIGLKTNKHKMKYNYRKSSNIIRPLLGNEIVDHLHVVGAWPAGAVPTTSSFSTIIWLNGIRQRQPQDTGRIF